MEESMLIGRGGQLRMARITAPVPSILAEIFPKGRKGVCLRSSKTTDIAELLQEINHHRDVDGVPKS